MKLKQLVMIVSQQLQAIQSADLKLLLINLYPNNALTILINMHQYGLNSSHNHVYTRSTPTYTPNS